MYFLKMNLSEEFNSLYNKIISEAETESAVALTKMIDEIKDIFNNNSLKPDEKLLSKIYVLSKRLLAGTDAENELLNSLLQNIKLTSSQAEEVV
jgi:hypothetical protein